MASFQSNALLDDFGPSLSVLMADPARRALATARFWGYVDSSAGEAGCWAFDNATRERYGSFKVPDGGSCGAHRFAYFLSRNAEAEGVVMHLCDNRRCVNPIHLRDGSQKENIRDAARKGRLGRRRRQPEPSTSPELEAMIEQIADRLGIKRPTKQKTQELIPAPPPRPAASDRCTAKNLQDPNFWPKDPQRRRALELIREKTSPKAVHCLTGVPLKTLRQWEKTLERFTGS